MSEHLFGEEEQGLFQVGERDIPVDIEAFHLVEHAVRAGRDGLVAEHPAGTDGPDRGFLVFHHPNLNRGGVGAEKDIGILHDKEGILHIAGRVLRREVQGGEDMPVVLDFRTG